MFATKMGVGSRPDAMLLQRLRNRAACDTMAQVFQSSLNPAVSPTRILFSHTDNQATDLQHNAGSPDSLSCIGPLCCDQSTVPGHDRVGSHERSHLLEHLPTKNMAFGCQTSPLVIGETKAFATKLFFEDSILFDQELQARDSVAKP